ncbi:MAG TPA: TetR/AcrR family transcriptional regulator C-terminal domain-containing protein [Bacilli bacterium]|nr:TetR/AcrR family transcriptional regulator C-terminal domain-containing protein [Bacilli bacterium]
MKTKYRLAVALKALMKTTPLDLISVKTLTEKCELNRQTFYYHFRNLYDLLMWIFLNEKISTEVADVNEALDVLITYLEKEHLFIENALNSAAKDLVMEFLFNKIYNMNLVLLKDDSKEISKNKVQYHARFLAAGLSNIIITYINEELDISLDEILATYKDTFTKTRRELSNA